VLTPRGRSVLALTLAFFGVGRVLALRELHMAAAALLVLLAFAVGTVIVRRGTMTVKRTLSASRTTAGGELRVDLAVANRGWIGGGPILFEDRVPERLQVSARLALPTLPPHSERHLAYVLRPRVRGRYTLGPLEIALTDPFGLVMRRQKLSGESTVVVYPSYERIETMTKDVQRVGAVRRSPLLGTGDEFYALRAYQEGDDLKKVHWPTSLRLGEIVVKQEELLREPGVLVVLDTCAPKHQGTGAGASIEAAVSACASVATLTLRLGMPLAIVTADGLLLRSRRPSEDEVLEALATVETTASTNLHAPLSTVTRHGVGGATLVTITPGLAKTDLARMREIAANSAGGASVLVDAPTFAPDDARDIRDRRAARTAHKALAVLGMPVVRLAAGDSFAQLWETGIAGSLVRSRAVRP
jgi:uncharacterized protein (DUF58 family)